MHKITKQSTVSTLQRMHADALSDQFRSVYISITQPQGEYIYDLLLRKKICYIVEFGCSLAVSTTYLAAAAMQNNGTVITTEMDLDKIQQAQKNLSEAEVASVVEIREGDAQKTLQDIDSGIEFLLLDGAKELYVPILKLLENKFARDILIYADNTDMETVFPFLRYIESHPEQYTIEYNPDASGRSALIQYIRPE